MSSTSTARMQRVYPLIGGIAAAVAGAVLTALLLHRQHRLSAGFTGGATAALVVVAVVAAALTRDGAVAPPRTPTAHTAFRPAATATAAPPPVVTTASWRPRILANGLDYVRVPRVSIPVFPRVLRGNVARAAHAMPAHGLVGSVRIPGTVSHYAARAAIVYLPPAALVPQPKLLPVVVMFSGQSLGAGPHDAVSHGDLGGLMDAIAARHHGVAPIVVVPDQLGSYSGDPMCIDSPLGHIATYVMRDVRSWILRRLPAATARTRWTVSGFSEGGTCAIQFASQHPDVFGSFVDVSGERAPLDGTVRHSIAAGFGGDARAYEHAGPLWVMAHRTYRDEEAYFAVGALDRMYGPVMPVMAAHAASAGMSTHRLLVHGPIHNWRVADAGFGWAFRALAARWRI